MDPARLQRNRARMLALTAEPLAGPATEADALLRPAACPRCDYSLTGLSAAGVCPECGRAYGAPEVVLYGHGEGDKATVWTGRRPTAVAVTLRWVAVGGLGFGMVAIGRSWRGPSFLWYWLAMAFVGAVGSTVRRVRDDDGAAPVQVRFTPAGIRQGTRSGGPMPFGHNADAGPVPWRRVRHLTFQRLSGGRVWVKASLTRAWWLPQWDYVNAVVACPPAAADALAERVAAWRSSSGSP